MKRILVAFAVLVSACVSFAQAPEVSKEMKDMEWMLGTWTGTFKYQFPGMEAMESTGTMTTTMDGMFQKSVSTSDMGGMQMSETSYFGWDPDKKRYTMWTFTNFAPTPRVEHGTMKGNVMVMTSEPWNVGMPGGPTVSRATLTKKSPTEVSFLLEFKDGDKWTKVGEGSMKKKA